MSRPHRSLALVTASLPRLCVVCGNTRLVQLVRYEHLAEVGRVNCPHCNNYGHPIPILTLPMRDDIPRGAA